MQRIKTGDEVIVIAGKDRGKRGKVLKLNAGRVMVDNINIVKKHVRPNPNKGEMGGIVEREASLDASNVALYNPVTDKADRVGFRELADGRKVRYFKSNGENVDV